MRQGYLLTGKPGTGKTSLIKQAVAGLKGKTGDFYTEEIRGRGIRQDFKLITLDGDSATLSHVNVHSPYRVSRYGVDIDSLERVDVSVLRQAAQRCDLVVVDEIGKMELFSTSFRDAILQIVDSGKKVVGTIMLNPNPWADATKLKPQVNLVEVTGANHGQVLEELRHWLDTTDGGREWG